MTDRYDLVLVGAGPSFALADGAARAFLRNLATAQLAVPADEAVAVRWAEVYLQPGALAHAAFIKGAAPPSPAFLEGVLHFGDVPESLPFGSLSAHFWLELRGALYADPAPSLLRRFETELGAHPRVLVRPHAGLPPHREVPEGERRPGAASKGAARVGPVGTWTEEF